MPWLKSLRGRSLPSSEKQRLRFEALEDRLVPSAPLVSSIFKPATPANAASVDYRVTFSESVSGVDVTDFNLVTNGVSGASITGVSPAGPATVYTVTVNTGSGDGSVRLDVLDDDSIVNGTDEPLGGPGADNGGLIGPTQLVDKTPPTVSSIIRADSNPTSAASADFTVSFTESVSGVDVGDFTLTTTGLSGASITNISPTGLATSFTVTVNTGSGSGTLRLDLSDDDSIEDFATNKLGGTGTGNGNFVAGEVYMIDRTPPTISSIVRADADPTNAASVNFTVTFNEDVTGVDVNDFLLTTNGLIGFSITGVSPAGPASVYTVTANTGSGLGTLRLDFHDDDSITDAADNPVGGSGASGLLGEEYTIDKSPPGVTLSNPSATATGSGPVSFTVNYGDTSNPLNITLTAADVILNATGTAKGVVNVTGSGDSRTITISDITGNGTLGISLPANTATDAAGNPAPASGPSTTFTVDNPPPTPPAPTPPAPASPPNARVAVGLGNAPLVAVFDARTGGRVLSFSPFPGFGGGVTVATGDVNRDGTPDTVVGTATGSSHVKVFDGATGAEIRSFLAFDGFAGGVTVAAGDVNGDGFADLVVGTATGGSHVKVFSGADGGALLSFLAFDGFGGGVTIGAGDVNHDGAADVIAGAATGATHVKAFDGRGGGVLLSFLAFPGAAVGVNVGAGDLNGDGFSEVLVGANANGHVKAFDGRSGAEVFSFLASPGFGGAVRVGAVDADGDGRADVLTGAGPGAGPHVKRFDGQTLALVDSFFAFDPNLTGGIFVG